MPGADQVDNGALALLATFALLVVFVRGIWLAYRADWRSDKGHSDGGSASGSVGGDEANISLVDQPETTSPLPTARIVALGGLLRGMTTLPGSVAVGALIGGVAGWALAASKDVDPGEYTLGLGWLGVLLGTMIGIVAALSRRWKRSPRD